jgi:DNA-binding NarL/FixJ family response regulator
LQFCQDLSKDNLELGCKIVKDTVFEEAVKRIRQDEEIKTALEKRVNAAKSGRPFVDETYVSNFADLPEKLKPNRNGLTSQQLQVYSDFSKLNQQYSF